MILKENLTLKYFRLIYFPIHFLLEITLTVLFLIMPFSIQKGSFSTAGYTCVFGIILACTSFILAVGISYLFISVFQFRKEERAQFFNKEKNQKIFIISIVFLLLVRIGILACALVFQIPFTAEFDRTAAILVLIGISTIPPFLLHFLSNFEISPTRVFSLSKEAPLTIKIATIWLVFLTGAMQVFSTEPVILIISLIILICSYFFFILNRLAVSFSAIVLFIHAAYSFLVTGIIFANMEEQVAKFNEQGFDYTQTDALLVNIFFFLIPGVISLVLAVNFYRKSVTSWVRSLYPDSESEMEITNYYADEDEDDSPDDFD